MASVISFPRHEVRAVGLIGFAHMLSHVYPMALPLLLSPITEAFQMSALEWGAALAVFAVATGILQTPVGFLVERVGGRRVLIFGLLVFSGSFFCVGWLATNFWEMLVLMAVAGIGNSVFHPADYSLISSSVGEERLGRAYSIHTFVGHFGFLAGPWLVVILLNLGFDWRVTMMVIGGIGLVMTLVLVVFGHLINEGNLVKKKASIADSVRELLSSRPVLLFFLFYMGSSMANYGVTQFSVVAFEGLYGFSNATAAIALTAYQLATLLFVLPGGLLADRTDRYDTVLMVGFGVAAVTVFLAGTNLLPYWLVVSCLAIGGAMRGAANASRDVAVRHVATNVPVGTVFGFVSTGFLVGQGLGGPIYGWLFDNYPPQMIFYASAAFSVLALGTVLANSGTRRSPEAAE
jgi:MFS family permease